MPGRSWRSAHVALTGVVLAFSVVSANAQSPQVPDQAVFAFGGGGVAQSLIPVTAPYEDNHILGIGYQKTLGQFGSDLSWGVEAGFAGRLGNVTSAEARAGLMQRHGDMGDAANADVIGVRRHF